MNIRLFFFLSLAVAVVAVGLQLAGMIQIGNGLSIRAHAITLSEAERAAAIAEADRYTNRGVACASVGIPVALASAALVAMSARRREPAWRLLTCSVLIFYLMLQFVLI